MSRSLTHISAAWVAVVSAATTVAASNSVFMLVTPLGLLISAVCPTPESLVPLLSRLLFRAGFAARRQTFVRRGQNCGVGLRSSGGWQMRRAMALRPAAQRGPWKPVPSHGVMGGRI